MDRFVVKEVAVVLHLDHGFSGQLRDIDAQLEVFKMARVPENADIQTCEAKLRTLRELAQIEEHIHERQAAGVAFECEPLNERAEAQLLMIHAVEHRFLRGLDELRERHAVRHGETQRQRIDGMADKVELARSDLARGGNADNQIVLPGQAVEQGGEAGQHGDKKGCAEFRTGFFHFVRQILRQHEVNAARGIGFDCGSPSVGGQIQVGRGTGELLKPVPLGLGAACIRLCGLHVQGVL